MTHDEAIAALKLYVIHEYDGSIGANFELDKLLWAVRVAHPHNHPKPHVRPTVPAVSGDQIEIDLEELGL